MSSLTIWECSTCGEVFKCTAGIPKLYIEGNLGINDRKLRDSFYNGSFGRFYQFMMPLIVLPVRPWTISRVYWAAFASVWLVLLMLIAAFIRGLSHPQAWGWTLGSLLILITVALFLRRERYLSFLLLLAVPTKLSLLRRFYRPQESFADVHARVLTQLNKRNGEKLQILDVSTGSCNSLYRHGWMSLNADYTAIDLSETMLRQGQEMMSRNNVAVDLVLGDALDLPFQAETFDVVLSYGAINGLTDPIKAIVEMARVAKPGAVLLFLDEQMYGEASSVERAYFKHVLSSHNVIHRCPVESFPSTLIDVRVSQVYQFYYICTARKCT